MTKEESISEDKNQAIEDLKTANKEYVSMNLILQQDLSKANNELELSKITISTHEKTIASFESKMDVLWKAN